MNNLESLLKSYSKQFSKILPLALSLKNTYHLDLSNSNPDLLTQDITDNDVFNNYLSQRSLKESARIPLGGYNEKRILYSKSNHFGSGKDARDIHLGIDIWVDAGTPVCAPLNSRVHSFANNTNYRDYGPTIILEHRLDGVKFYTLYGHLSKESLADLYAGKKIKSGEVFASIGGSDINGSWPPHLHLQLIKDMAGYEGDFPGVCSSKERVYYLDICPDPSAFLGLDPTN